MTISPYQVNSNLKAYIKQSKVKPQQPGSGDIKNSNHFDVVSLSSENDSLSAYNKISYSLLDVILKTKE